MFNKKSKSQDKISDPAAAYGRIINDQKKIISHQSLVAELHFLPRYRHISTSQLLTAFHLIGCKNFMLLRRDGGRGQHCVSGPINREIVI